jgi:hypothetical protein
MKLHRLVLPLLVLILSLNPVERAPAAGARLEPPCERPGWFPDNVGLKDHSVFFYDGAYYLVSIHVQSSNRFVYARSTDLCTWEELAPLRLRSGEWDEMAIWAPFVYEEQGRYYMYYTGVTHSFTQSIMLAVSDNPADPLSWQEQGVVFQPAHEGMVWAPGVWSDCRDPSLFRVEDTYYLLYTGADEAGGILGLATAKHPAGPWQDWGAILPANPSVAYESPALVRNGSHYYLFYNLSSTGERYRTGATPPEGKLFTSYLTGYTVSISPLIWDDFFSPPRPWIGSQVHHLLLPSVLH